MRIGSLFSGIGGLELGLEWAGVGWTAWHVEQNPFCQQILRERWGEGPQLFADVREVGAHNLEPVDVICGGFPCQDISGAGKRVGIGGERSGLWREFARIVRELRPRYVVVENVADLLIRGAGDVLGDLAESGYDAEWDCIPAASVGAPHRRDRVFIIACLDDTERSGLERHARHGLDAQGWEEQGRSASTRGIRGRGHASGWWASEPDVGRVVDGISAHMDCIGGVPIATAPPRPAKWKAGRQHRLMALGNAVVPQVAEVIGRRILELEAER